MPCFESPGKRVPLSAISSKACLMISLNSAAIGTQTDLPDDTVVRPYGIVGLVLSFIGICLLGALFMGIAWGIWVAIEGMETVSRSMGGLGTDINEIRNATYRTQMMFYGVTAVSFVSFGLAALIFARLRGGPQWRKLVAWREPLGWPEQRGQLVLLGLALVYLLIAGFGIKLIYPQFRTWFFVPEGASGIALSILTVVILAPLVEELIFRGWIYTSLRNSFGAWAAIIATALVFAVVHMDATRLYPLLIFVPGLLLTIIRERNGSAKASFYAHALYNGMAWLIVFFVGNP